MGWCEGWGGDGMSSLNHHEPTNHEDMLVNIYVSNLSYTTTEDELSHLFDAYGTVESVRIITDRATGRSRGFAFIEMPNGTEARAAMAGLNGTVLGERTLTVTEARPRDAEHKPPAFDQRKQAIEKCARCEPSHVRWRDLVQLVGDVREEPVFRSAASARMWAALMYRTTIASVPT